MKEREDSIFSNRQHFAVSTGICGVACPLPALRVDKPLVPSSYTVLLCQHSMIEFYGQEQLQMFQVGQNSCKCFSYKSKIADRALHHQEKGYLHQATNSQSEQLVALSKNSFMWARIASAANASATKAGIIKRKGYLHHIPSYGEQLQKPEQFHVQCLHAILLCSAVQCQYSTVRFFSSKEQVYTENQFLK